MLKVIFLKVLLVHPFHHLPLCEIFRSVCFERAPPSSWFVPQGEAASRLGIALIGAIAALFLIITLMS